MSDSNLPALSRRRYCAAIGAAAATGLLGSTSGLAEESVGSGGYHLDPPEGASTHQYDRHTTESFGDGPIPTNDWYTTIPMEGITGDGTLIAAHPLFFKTQETGLEVGHPTTWETSWNESAQVGDAWMDDEMHLSIAHADAEDYNDVALDAHGDWSASAVWGEGTDAELRTTIAQGSPFVFCEAAEGGVAVAFDDDPDMFTADGAVVGVTVDDVDYGLYAPADDAWDLDGDVATTTGEYCTVAVLPDAAFLDPVADYAYNRVTNTVFDWEYDREGAQAITSFSFETESEPESNASGTLTALYPHQWKDADDDLLAAELDVEATYPSPRGEMRLVAVESFDIPYRYGGTLPFLPDEGNYDRDQIESEIAAVDTGIAGGVDQDTYNFGKEAASRLAKTAAVADQLGMDDERDAMLDAAREGLEEWFTPSESATFYYDDSLGALMGVPDSHGSITELNDHHFHYGHYVWAAARIARHDPDWVDDWGEMVEELIHDYASPQRDHDRYPFTRNFSVYAGHSWAHGSGGFDRGNNQESSSEALMSYAAMIEWGAHTGNDEIRDFGIVLYSMHVRAIREYWYDADEEHFPAEWESAFAGIVWGDGVAHSTWWTDDSEAVVGINMLPLAGYSLHLGRDQEAAERTFDAIAELKDDEFTYWPDVMWMYRAFSDSEDAIDRFESRLDSYDRESAQETAHTRYWLYALDAMGSPTTSVTADTPFYTVFDDGDELTYAAYNATDTETTVTFSDGAELTVPPTELVASRGPPESDSDGGNGDENDDNGEGSGDRGGQNGADDADDGDDDAIPGFGLLTGAAGAAGGAYYAARRRGGDESQE
ncbi:glycosyl hydrolase [Halobacteria archaeon AArc-dxtr1]|nr:glycosyl hydrolase [Halobacteria archaeon AArc-dxtr1]